MKRTFFVALLVSFIQAASAQTPVPLPASTEQAAPVPLPASLAEAAPSPVPLAPAPIKDVAGPTAVDDPIVKLCADHRLPGRPVPDANGIVPALPYDDQDIGAVCVKLDQARAAQFAAAKAAKAAADLQALKAATGQ